MHLPRGFGRGAPAEPGRSVSRSRTFRPHLLQPGEHVRAGHPADRRRDGLVHCGGAYVPAMSDETIIVRNQGTIFLGGPPLVKAATGEIVTAEELGGADVHTKVSGVADHLAQDDRHALELARRDRRAPGRAENRATRMIVAAAACARSGRSSTASSPPTRAAVRRARGHRAHRRLHPSSTNSKHVTARRSSAASLTSRGYPVGIVANNGILFSESALKGAHFIELCAQRGIPLVFLQNITGFMVGENTRPGASPKTARRWSLAVACARVPKFTVIVGGSFGAGNYGMCGRAYAPRFLWMWPNARISRDGRRAGGERARAGASRRPSKPGRKPGRQRTRTRFKSPCCEQYGRAEPRRTMPARDCGTTASSSLRRRAACSPPGWQRASTHRSRRRPSVSSACDRCERGQTTFSPVLRERGLTPKEQHGDRLGIDPR